MLAIFALITRPTAPLYGLIAYPLTQILCHFYSEGIIKKNAVG